MQASFPSSPGAVLPRDFENLFDIEQLLSHRVDTVYGGNVAQLSLLCAHGQTVMAVGTRFSVTVEEERALLMENIEVAKVWPRDPPIF